MKVERDSILEEIKELEKKVESELMRQTAIRTRRAEIEKQHSIFEEVSQQNVQLENTLSQKHQQIEEKKVLLSKLQAKCVKHCCDANGRVLLVVILFYICRKEELDRCRNEKKEQLEAAKARHASLLQENSDKKKTMRECLIQKREVSKVFDPPETRSPYQVMHRYPLKSIEIQMDIHESMDN